MFIQKKANRRVTAGEDVDVTPEANEVLFQADDVADVLAEVTGEDVSADIADEETGAVEFTIGDPEDGESYIVEPEGDEEVVETSTKTPARKRAVKASARPRKTASRKAPVKASNTTKPAGRRVVRRASR